MFAVRSFNLKRHAIFVGALAITAVAGHFFTGMITRYGEHNEREHLLSLAATAAASINHARLASLRGSPEDLASPDYERIRSQLIKTKAAIGNARFVYLMGLHDYQVIFLADAEPPDSDDYSRPGDAYAEASAALRESFFSGEAFVEGPQEDLWGVWVTGLAPIRNPLTGSVIAVFGVDIDARVWQRTIWVYRWFGVAITGFIALILLTFLGLLSHVSRSREQIRRARDSAESASDAKSRFLATVSHEIRTPLNGIIGMTELAMDAVRDDELMKIMHSLNTEAGSLLALVNQLLDFSKIEAGKLELEHIAFDLGILLDDVVSSFAVMAQQKRLELNLFVPADLPTRLVGDPTRLRRILVNLIGNAIKFTLKGEVYIQAHLLEEGEHAVRVRLDVKDTGIGIPAEKLAHIFESFTQADSSTTREFGGTGLGTTIAKRLVELMGGTIGVESQEGRGSTFWLTLAFPRQPAVTGKTAQQDDRLDGLRVLVVAENQTSRSIFAEYLSARGCSLTDADSAEHALALIRQSASADSVFDLLLANAELPGMSGFALAGQVRKMDAVRDLPIILMTSVGTVGDGKRCAELNINGYLTKPIRHDVLYKTIALVLGRSAGRESTAPSPGLVTTHTVTEEYGHGARILLVEDYPTNQQIAARHLRSVGYHVDLALDGQQAVAACRQRRYDLVLMDIEMPVMDGFEATRAIRGAERTIRGEQTAAAPAYQRAPTPIIAMTAHAVEGYREQCLQAGMDAFITKPLRRRELLAMVETWVGLRSAAPAQDTAPQAPAPVPDNRQAPMDFEAALGEFMGDRQCLMGVIEEFLKRAAGQISSMRQALAAGQSEELRRQAHAIRGGAQNLMAAELAAAALEVEEMGTANNFDQGSEKLARLEAACAQLEQFVRLHSSAHGAAGQEPAGIA